MELNSVDGKAAMCQAHDQAIGSLGGHSEIGRKAGSFDDQRMIARRPERRMDAAKHSIAVVPDLGKLAVHLKGGAHDSGAKCLSDRLMTQADAEHWDARSGL